MSHKYDVTYVMSYFKLFVRNCNLSFPTFHIMWLGSDVKGLLAKCLSQPFWRCEQLQLQYFAIRNYTSYCNCNTLQCVVLLLIAIAILYFALLFSKCMSQTFWSCEQLQLQLQYFTMRSFTSYCNCNTLLCFTFYFEMSVAAFSEGLQ